MCVSETEKLLFTFCLMIELGEFCIVINQKKFVIFSDSLSSLMAIHNRHLETGYVQKVNQLPVNSGKTITVCCIPSHVGIRGN